MANWRLSVTGGDSIDLDETFNLSQHRRRTSFQEQILEGQDGVVIDGESRRKEAESLILTGLMKEGTPSATETKYMELETLMASTENALNLIHIPTSNSWHVQHSETNADRLGGGILHVTITLRTGVTIV